MDYRNIEQLIRRIDSLEKKVSVLQKQNTEMYKVLKAKNSFLDFKFYEDEEVSRERNLSRGRSNEALLEL